jgi:O-antigen ligase
MASSGHPLALGGLLAYAFGFWLVLRTRVNSGLSRWTVSLLLWGGLLAAYSRGPWLGALCIYVAFLVLRSRSFSRLVRSGSALVFLLALVALTPFAGRFVNVLPFLGGTVDAQSLDYREQLLTSSWSIIKKSPLFGNQNAVLQMQGLRQGQGIIDLVNTYIGVLLASGFAGLVLFLTLFGGALLSARAWSKRILPVDPELGLLGASLVACMLGMLLMLADGSFIMSAEWLFYALVALAVAYANLCRVSLTQPVGLSAQRPRAAVRLRS